MDAVVSSKSLLRTGCPSKSDEELPCQKLAKHSLTWQVPVGCVSIFLDKNRRYIGKSQSVRRKGISGAWMEAGGAYKHRPAVTSLMSSSVSANSSSASLAGRPRCRANSPFVSMRPPASTSWVCGAARECQFEDEGRRGVLRFRRSSAGRKGARGRAPRSAATAANRQTLAWRPCHPRPCPAAPSAASAASASSELPGWGSCAARPARPRSQYFLTRTDVT
jgi:hypothetical protein